MVLSSTQQEEEAGSQEESRRPLEQVMLLRFLSLMGIDCRSGEDSLGLWLLMSKAPVLGDSSA